MEHRDDREGSISGRERTGSKPANSLTGQVVSTSRRAPDSKVMMRLAKIAAVLGAITAVFVAGKELFSAAKALGAEVTSTLRAQRDALKKEEAAKKAAHDEEEKRQLRTFGSYADLVKQHRDIALRTVNYMKELEAAGGYCEENAVRAKAALDKYRNGVTLYYSEEFKEYREIHQFYEDLGLQVHKKAADIDLVFELVTFPTDFVKKTECLAVALSENWFGAGQRIAGFNENTERLMSEYSRRRKANAVAAGRPYNEPPSCHCTALGLPGDTKTK